MTVKTLTVGPVQTNCYIAYDEETREAFLVDPGDEAERILAFLLEKNLCLTHILLTHTHFDHVLALPAVKAATGAKICVHEKEKDNLETGAHPEMRMLGLSALASAPIRADLVLRGGETLPLLRRTFTVLSTPGHTPGSVCYDDGEALFSGDTLFAYSCGRTDLPGGSTEEMLASLRMLSKLDGDRRVYPGHGGETTLARERAANFTMREAMR